MDAEIEFNASDFAGVVGVAYPPTVIQLALQPSFDSRFICHSRAGGNPNTLKAIPHRCMDSRLRGNDGGGG